MLFCSVIHLILVRPFNEFMSKGKKMNFGVNGVFNRNIISSNSIVQSIPVQFSITIFIITVTFFCIRVILVNFARYIFCAQEEFPEEK